MRALLNTLKFVRFPLGSNDLKSKAQVWFSHAIADWGGETAVSIIDVISVEAMRTSRDLNSVA